MRVAEAKKRLKKVGWEYSGTYRGNGCWEVEASRFGGAEGDLTAELKVFGEGTRPEALTDLVQRVEKMESKP